MRKHLIWMLALATAVSVAGVAQATDSTGTDFSLLKTKVTPSKLSKTKYKSAKLFVETSTLNNTNPGTPTNPGNTPVPTSNVQLKFDKDLKFTTKGLAQCTKSLDGTTTATANQLCGSSKVGGGQATACIGSASPCNKVSFVVTAFNGPLKGGKPTIILHSRDDAINTTTVLVGTLDPKTNVLNVPIPPAVYALATIADFQTTVKKSFSSKGKKYSYVSARCSHGSFKLKGTFKYSNGDPDDHPTATSKCTN
jgi:hypothetical protein